jgi:hypothetical protein
VAKTLPGKAIRTTSRAGIGGGALLIGLALFLLFRGFGPGGTGASGSGTGTGEAGDGKADAMVLASTTVSQQSATDAEIAQAGLDKTRAGLTDDEKKALNGNVLTVLIDEHDYRIQLPGTPDAVYRAAPLDRIVELATLANGDSNGIRVQILRRESARASAEEKLKLELTRKGIHEDAVVMPGDFVP